ncbi:MAG: tRNA (adenosine(37)-N6)-threonylcarbamoyltransferase complex transferase subunit TsaD, partial [Acidobacteria bacterium]|nr:tRNA (adenosine(37)-N6)-threonylcarbamoyltransferase complex transferase subunit TsaD [Acidobacteriota bacterium]
GYPGGPAIDRAAREGDDRAVKFSMPRMTHADRNNPRADFAAEFSFSGLKTAVVRHLEKRGVTTLEGREAADLAASFQRVVVETLLDRTFEVAESLGAKSIGIAGGVSANSRLRADAEARGARRHVPVYIPRLALSTDNAAMIAAAGLRRLELGRPGPADFTVSADIPINA